MSEWISVDDRLPGKRTEMARSKNVLAWCADIECTFTACFNFQDNGWEYFARGTVEMHQRVTHWMPLPSPPKESE